MDAIVPLNLPPFDARIAWKGNRRQVFDMLRQRYVSLTPEEWVRQHFVHYLICYLGYPKGLLANEFTIRLNGTSKRCDTVLFDTHMQPRVIVEYKAPSVKVTPKVFQQISRYNMALHVDYLMVSNGLEHFCCQMDYAAMSYAFLPEIPSYAEAFG